nr:uncharacterized protein LOC126528979 isoform X1 [Dermacentor andersoni]XP_054925504.1 uncharacterized protein LOC126528979 isoform X1 [Dermacentor andersoni]XP_054925505.1 uncharacterized protein LOC126528979 isoform X1 [Dermacentor andersoni]
MSGKRTRSFKIAVHRRDERDIWQQQTRAGAGNYCQRHGSLSAATTPGRGYYGCGSSSSAADDEEDPWRRPGAGARAEGSVFRSMVRAIATEFLPDGRDRKYYADHYSCRPPPLFVFVVTLIELGFFTYYTVTTGAVTPTGPVPIDSFFIYRPDKRLQVWRFVFYMVLHAGWIHLLFNLLVQMLVGLPLEMVHGSLRIGTVYMAGVLAGQSHDSDPFFLFLVIILTASYIISVFTRCNYRSRPFCYHSSLSSSPSEVSHFACSLSRLPLAALPFLILLSFSFFLSSFKHLSGGLPRLVDSTLRSCRLRKRSLDSRLKPLTQRAGWGVGGVHRTRGASWRRDARQTSASRCLLRVV